MVTISMRSLLPIWALLATTLLYSASGQQQPNQNPQSDLNHGQLEGDPLKGGQILLNLPISQLAGPQGQIGVPQGQIVGPPGQQGGPFQGQNPWPDPYQHPFPPNPCPHVFKYSINTSSGVPYGEAVIQPQPGSQDFELEVNMTVNAAVNQDDGLKISVLSGQNDILSGRQIRYAIRFPVSVNTEIPWLTQLRFNRAVLCSGSGPSLEEGKVQSAMWAKSTITTKPSGPNVNAGPFQPPPQGPFVIPTAAPGGYPGGAGFPGQVGYPGVGSYPGQVGYPGVGGYPGHVGYPGGVSYPGGPGYPSQGGYPGGQGYPSQGGYPGGPGYPSQGGYPGGGALPGQGGYPGYPNQVYAQSNRNSDNSSDGSTKE